ncbi:putative major allergen alt protein [Lasiodiplodia theobromae]|uniref:AA1-like domain-containing protein n=1 Tax=Lasiodiplodia theobromae TaxID=45133 RepID=A0A5N5DF12_9PEZI|nr:Major allergen Alt [Lasiodiplodia theobromae]KAB2576227.1 hypothetical protein DBV05_g5057 [Lasiodiplodia theobromae]KAF4533985.1 Major allergen Alt [Lasiodiplodia theobromae]KAF9638272.1 putative major allergen alt protein [Lasiodiplodia theobromae]
MQFITSLLALGTVASAAVLPIVPNLPTEEASITDLYARKLNGTAVDSLSFKLSIDGKAPFDCSSSTFGFGQCNTTDAYYGFGLQNNGSSTFTIAISKVSEDGYSIWGQGAVPTYCHAGGAGPKDFVCSQVNNATNFKLSFGGSA